MKPDLAKYANMKICVAVSGGKDSMALLHYLYAHKGEYGITLSALNCEHGLRGERSREDSRFVERWCKERCIPLLKFSADCAALAKERGVSVETASRDWRQWCYYNAALGKDAVATAHHLNDNAETILFNLARGSALSGLTGIGDGTIRIKAYDDERLRPEWEGGNRRIVLQFNVIRPLSNCSREEIDLYVKENGIPYVEDESNYTDEYTRNKIRHNVLPELERAVPGAAKSIYRFSRLAAEDEEYFDDLIESRKLVKATSFGFCVGFCKEKVVFRRAVIRAVRYFDVKDYTAVHADSLYGLQFAENGKKFEFLGLIAYREKNNIVITRACGDKPCEDEIKFCEYRGDEFCGQPLYIGTERGNGKSLMFDRDLIPETAVIRFMKTGDKFTKFGGGTKSLGDFFTDRKIPVRIRKNIPLIADGSDILAVCGVEISDKIKITTNTQNVGYICCADYAS